jgi:acetoin utilization deacetylase AcuC-like enzyme
MTGQIDVFWHDDALAHDTGHGVFDGPPSDLLAHQMRHPENPERIANMREILRKGPVAPELAWHAGRRATQEEVLRFHTQRHLAGLEAAARTGQRFSRSTLLPKGGLPAVLAAAGTAIAAAGHVADEGGTAIALIRPPGHHAAPEMVDGYCFLNNIGIAIEALRATRKLKRFAVVDWDVHHGNGTQSGFYERSDVLTISLHMDHGSWGPSHPETGRVDERGRGAGEGFNLNLPLPLGAGDSTYHAVFDRIVAPAVRRHKPDVLVIANGEDANQYDPNGRQAVTMAGFHGLGARAQALAAEVSNGRLLVVQEGGYSEAYAAFCLHSIVEGLVGRPQSLPDTMAFLPDPPERMQRDLAALGEELARNGVTVDA